MSRFKPFWHGKFVHFIEFFFDMILLITSIFIVAQVSYFFSRDIWVWWDTIAYLFIDYWWFVLIYLLLAALVFKMYHTSVIYRTYRRTMQNIFLSLFWINVVLMIVSLFNQNPQFFIITSPLYVILAIAIQMVLFAIFKYIAYKIFGRYNKQTVLIIGKEQQSLDLAKQFYTNADHFREIKYLVYIDNDGTIHSNIFNYINEVDCVYICEDLSSRQKDQILEYSALQNYKQVYIVPTKTQILTLNASFDRVDDTLVLRAENMHLSFEMRFIKRTIDLIVSTIGLLIALIPMLIVALIIKLQDGGPVFYKQERFKRGNKPFYILKFRSMTHKQTKDQEQTLATRNDSRITPFGKFIRATRLDELPQLINVFKSDMSLVGPRPVMKSVVDEAISDNPDFRYRTNVKPGVTGLAQVYGRYDTTSAERLRYDLLYVRKCSLLLDIKIILLTVMTMLSKDAGLGRHGTKSFEDTLARSNHYLDELNDFALRGKQVKLRESSKVDKDIKVKKSKKN